MGEYSTLEIAALCQRTERTVQRWLATRKLKAIHLLGNRYSVDEDDLQPFLPPHEVESLSEQLSALERRLDAVEQLVSKHDIQIMVIWDSVKPKKREIPLNEQGLPTIVRKNTVVSHDPLPDGYAALTSWCELHGIAETTARRYLPPDAVKKGAWTGQDGSLVKVAIDQSTQHHLWDIFYYKTKFTPCAHCPHDKLV